MCDMTQELEHLKKLAKEDSSKRFDRLYRLLRQGGLLNIAKERIATNNGAQTPGVDGQKVIDIDNEAIVRLCAELKTGNYQPQPVWRVFILKRNGKLRPLGIPTSRDRTMQVGVALILEAIYEPIFHKSSRGFRPQQRNDIRTRMVIRSCLWAR